MERPDVTEVSDKFPGRKLVEVAIADEVAELELDVELFL